MYLPRLSVRHVSDGITRIENILNYNILMSVFLYISNDNTVQAHMYTYVLTMLIRIYIPI